MPSRFDSLISQKHTHTDWIRRKLHQTNDSTFKKLFTSSFAKEIFQFTPAGRSIDKARISRPKNPQYHLLADPDINMSPQAANIGSAAPAHLPPPSPRKVRSLAAHEIKREHTNQRAARDQKKQVRLTLKRKSILCIPKLTVIDEREHQLPLHDEEIGVAITTDAIVESDSTTLCGSVESTEYVAEPRESLDEEREACTVKPNSRLQWTVQPPLFGPGCGPLNSHPTTGREVEAAMYELVEQRRRSSRTASIPSLRVSTYEEEGALPRVSQGPVRNATSASTEYEKLYSAYLRDEANEILYTEYVSELYLQHGKTASVETFLAPPTPGEDEDKLSLADLTLPEVAVSSHDDLGDIDDILAAADHLRLPSDPRHFEHMLSAAGWARARRGSNIRKLADADEEKEEDVEAGASEGRERSNSIGSVNSDDYEGDEGSLMSLAESVAMMVKAVKVDA